MCVVICQEMSIHEKCKKTHFFDIVVIKKPNHSFNISFPSSYQFANKIFFVPIAKHNGLSSLIVVAC